jgi:serine/threonine-protein kinase HipA
VLPALARAGGSAAGAWPKVLVAYDAMAGEMRSGAEDTPAGFQPYLVKFPTKEDGADIGAVEMAYAAMARAAGIAMPATRLFSAGRRRRCFGVERFDRVRAGTSTERRHVHSLGGLLHASHRAFGCTYSQFLRATARLTNDRREVVEAFRRMVFNVLACNRDDHVRNFAFLMEPGGTWRLSPAYDLVYSSGPGSEHSMMIGTEGSRPTYRNFLEVAAPEGIAPHEVAEIVDRVAGSVMRWPEFAGEQGVARATIARVRDAITRTCADGRIGGP